MCPGTSGRSTAKLWNDIPQKSYNFKSSPVFHLLPVLKMSLIRQCPEDSFDSFEQYMKQRKQNTELLREYLVPYQSTFNSILFYTAI